MARQEHWLPLSAGGACGRVRARPGWRISLVDQAGEPRDDRGVQPAFNSAFKPAFSFAFNGPFTAPSHRLKNPMQLASVVFYGRSGEQALAMFNLEGDLEQWRDARVLDCPGGPGSLSARLRGLVGEVVAVDPLYALPEEELEQRALADLERTMAGLRSSPTLRPDFDLEACREEHIQALQIFLEDRRRHPEHYRNASLPELPFPDQSFDLVLSGHLLFAYAPCAMAACPAVTPSTWTGTAWP